MVLVRLTGLEPARRETLDPKSNASTNSATGALLFGIGCKGKFFFSNINNDSVFFTQWSCF